MKHNRQRMLASVSWATLIRLEIGIRYMIAARKAAGIVLQ